MRAAERRELSRLMARLAEGDRDAFDPVFVSLWTPLRAYCVRLMGSEADGEDVAQQALLKIFSRADEFESGRDALRWALGIATWECRSARRRSSRSRVRSFARPPEARDLGVTPEEGVWVGELRHALDQALGELSASDRAFLHAELRDEEHMGAKPAAIRKRRQRALARLRSIWRFGHD